MIKKFQYWLAIVWGTLGLVMLLTYSIVRLAAIAWQITEVPTNWWHWAVLFVWIVFMAYSEGYKGFQCAFAPRVAARLIWLATHPKTWLLCLAPLYAMGFVYARCKRVLISFTILLMVIGFVLIAEVLPTPWRSIVDAGVVVGLAWGLLATVAAVAKAVVYGTSRVDPELPTSEKKKSIN